jgi:hypothetical protein
MAIGGLTPYEKLLKIKNEKNLTENSNCAIIEKMQQEKEVVNKNLDA